MVGIPPRSTTQFAGRRGILDHESEEFRRSDPPSTRIPLAGWSRKGSGRDFGGPHDGRLVSNRSPPRFFVRGSALLSRKWVSGRQAVLARATEDGAAADKR